ncbi:hypothetical protein CPU12_07365 [Malaciobacter molluscorum LMG 25693]|uniref:Glyoxalase-like domain-containing protein n=1 Tax=Malaciobacter molluscorum LMG 25693 TaxID=870501 RepID=A0A2G1DHW1_9BACT|nr:hypothetical protein [Malaciobacter molluscorum]AXX93020.1 hypothetical protein AMOL_2066 [Malaciobacter molluscorum LMG 25693]PHO18077.1 hypothetical protein CPU12_07365 [Malaciobacter molluscorum LMG 25693]
MFKLDHLMIEVDNPQIIANDIASKFKLPYAWPLIQTDNYLSIGINFGDINIEFIKFNKRFGIGNINYDGFSGIAFTPTNSELNYEEYLKNKNLFCKIGEETETYTTTTIECNEVFPTIFLVKYHFDTAGWKKKLKDDFENCKGGVYGIKNFKSLEVDFSKVEKQYLFEEFKITSSTINQITFSSSSSNEKKVINIIPNLKIIVI